MVEDFGGEASGAVALVRDRFGRDLEGGDARVMAQKGGSKRDARI